MARKKQPALRIQQRKLGRHQAKGLYHFPARANASPLIEIDPRQTPIDELDTVCHEGLHHIFPDVTEEKITAAGTALAKILWAYGYRKVTQ